MPPYNLRTPTRLNHDLTLFKNFAIKGDQKLQFRVGFFNLFNQAFATTTVAASDINLTLDTTCNVTVNRVPDGAGGLPTTSAIRRRASTSRRRRRTTSARSTCSAVTASIEFVLKYYF